MNELRPQDWIAIALAAFFKGKGRDLSPELQGSLTARMFLACVGYQGKGDHLAFYMTVFGCVPPDENPDPRGSKERDYYES